MVRLPVYGRNYGLCRSKHHSQTHIRDDERGRIPVEGRDEYWLQRCQPPTCRQLSSGDFNESYWFANQSQAGKGKDTTDSHTFLSGK